MRNLFVSFLFILCVSRLDAQPVITLFSPKAGPVGTSITITGKGFSSNPSDNYVSFGSVKAVVTGASATSLTVTVPAGISYLPIAVTTNHLTAYSNKPFNLTFPGCNINDVSFEAKKDFSTGNSPVNISSADLDGDGKQDIVTLNSLSSTLSIFQNTSAGGTISFASRFDLPASSGAQALLVTDLNGDGLPDLVVANTNLSSVSVYANTSVNGTISFVPKSDYATALGPASLAFGDLDSDGKPELVVGNNNTFSIFKNKSSGTISFDTRVDQSTGSLRPRSIAIADLDLDGKPDIAVQSNSSLQDSVCIYRNTSTVLAISFAARLQYPSIGFGRSILLADIDGDDKADIITSNNTTSNVSVFRNNSQTGSLQFDSRLDFPSGFSPEGLAVSDINGDGNPDILICSTNSGTISILKNTSSSGSISFSTKVDYPSGSLTRSVCTPDMDLNGTPEIVSADYFRSTFSVFRKPFSQRFFLVDSSKTNSSAIGLCSVNSSDWANACNNLQTAIDSSREGDQIWVVRGTYFPVADTSGNKNPVDVKNKTFLLKSGVKIFGGFSGTETALAQRPGKTNTILSGFVPGSAIKVYTVVTSIKSVASTTLDGFIIRDGKTAQSGAGLSITGSAITVNNCIIANNAATGQGGGIYITGSSSPVFTNCSMTNNTASQGGAIAIINSQPVFHNCTIAANSATGNGGGIYNQNSLSVINNSILWGNSGTNAGIDNLSSASGTLSVNYSIVGLATGIFTGNSNWNTNPLFVDGLNGNFILTNGSFAITAGNVSVYPANGPVKDLNGNPRIDNGTFSIGAYQGGTTAVTNAAGILYVNSQSVSPFATGKSWATAYSTLSEALIVSNGNTAVKQIWVAKGTYTPGNDSLLRPQAPGSLSPTFAIKRTVQIYGGFLGTETDLKQRSPTANLTSLDAKTNFNGVNNQIISLMTVVNVQGSLVDGFTFTNGAGNSGTYGGGGAYTKNANTTFNNCRFLENGGSAIYNFLSTLTVTNCYFSGNFGDYGGALNFFYSTGTVLDCKFIDNKPPVTGFPYVYGGAISAEGSSLTINGCEFKGNKAIESGGALFFESTKAALSNCSFIENSTNPIQGYGGAIYSYNQSDVRLINCAFVRNVAQVAGAIENISSTLTLTNCTITDHTAYYYGGIVTGGTGSTAVISNSIIWGNKSIYDARGNELFDGDKNNAIGTFTVTNSLIGDGVYRGITNPINLDPKFVDTSKALVQLLSNSPAIDAGNNSLYSGNIVTDTDLGGHPRLTGTKIDMGAFEYYTVTCEAGTVSFVSNLTGSSYQWEQNSGNGFFSLINDSHFSGANTNTLIIKNVPASWSGSQFRCLVGNSYSTTFPLVVDSIRTPSVIISADTTSVCSGSTVNFKAVATNGGSLPQYQWKINGVNAGYNTSDFSPNTLNNNDNVSVQLTSNASCLAQPTVVSNPIQMNVAALPIANAGTDQTICSGQQGITLGSPAETGKTYSWSPATGLNSTTIAQPTANPVSSTTYTVKVTNSFGCNSVDDVLVMVVPSPAKPTISSGSSNTFCAGSSVVLNTSSSGSFQWMKDSVAIPNATTSSYTATISGNYSVYSSNGVCNSPSSSPVAVIVNPVPPKPTISVAGNTLTSSAAQGNQWYLNGTAIPNANGTAYVASVSGQYTVMVSLNNCSSEMSADVTVVMTALNSPNLSRQIMIAPNPVHNSLKIWYTGSPSTFHLSMLDLSGRIMFERLEFFTSYDLNMSKYPAGIYLIRIVNSKGEQTQKVISKF